MRTLQHGPIGVKRSEIGKNITLGNQDFQQVLFHAFFTRFNFEKIFVENNTFLNGEESFQSEKVLQNLIELTGLPFGEDIYNLYSSELGTTILNLDSYKLHYKRIATNSCEIPSAKMYVIQSDLSPILIKTILRELGNNLNQQPFYLLIFCESEDFFKELHEQSWITPTIGLEWGTHLKAGLYQSI